MTCERCQGLLVVEPLPLVLEAERYHSKEFGYVRCLNCGDQMDLYIWRRRQREKEIAKLEKMWKA